MRIAPRSGQVWGANEENGKRTRKHDHAEGDDDNGIRPNKARTHAWGTSETANGRHTTERAHSRAWGTRETVHNRTSHNRLCGTVERNNSPVSNITIRTRNDRTEQHNVEQHDQVQGTIERNSTVSSSMIKCEERSIGTAYRQVWEMFEPWPDKIRKCAGNDQTEQYNNRTAWSSARNARIERHRIVHDHV